MKKVVFTLMFLLFFLSVAHAWSGGCVDLDGSGNCTEADLLVFESLQGNCQDEGTLESLANFDGDNCINEEDRACFMLYYLKKFGQQVNCATDKEEPCGCIQGCADLAGGPITGTGDGKNSLLDFGTLASTMNKCQGDIGFNPLADFDGDGCVYWDSIPSSSTNLALNSSFEVDNGTDFFLELTYDDAIELNNVPDGWAKATHAVFSLDPVEKVDGSFSVKLGELNGFNAYLVQRFPINVFKTYTVSGWIKTSLEEGSGYGVIATDCFTSSDPQTFCDPSISGLDNYENKVYGETPWQYIEFNVSESDPSAKFLQIQCYAMEDPVGDIWCDGIKVVESGEITAPEPLIDEYCFQQSPLTGLTCNFAGIPGGCPDYTDDGIVDVGDLSIIAAILGKTPNDEGFNPLMDFDGDDLITSVDLVCFNKSYGSSVSCPEDYYACGCFDPSGEKVGCGDLDGDGEKTDLDLGILTLLDGTCTGETGFNPNADFDGDGCINSTQGSGSAIDRICFELEPTSGLSCPRYNLPPAQVSNVMAIGRTDRIEISWDENPFVSLGYELLRRTSSSSTHEKIHSGFLSAASYVDSDVVEGTTYYYVVTASNDFGDSLPLNEVSASLEEESECDPSDDGYCNPDCVRAQDPDCHCNNNLTCESTWENHANCPNDCPDSGEDTPLPPVNLKAESGDGFVFLDWAVQVGEHPTSFNVYRKETGTFGYTKLGSASMKEFTDLSAGNRKSYDYAVTALKSGMESSYSEPSTAEPEGVLLNPPSNLDADFGQARVRVSWSKASPEPDHYAVYRRIEAESSFSFLDDSFFTQFVDDSIESGNTYFYMVRSVSLSGEESTDSAKVRVVVPVPNECNPADDNYCDSDCERTEDPDCVCVVDGNCEIGIEDANNCPADCRIEPNPDLVYLVDWSLGLGLLTVSLIVAVVFFNFSP